ncbi:MAG TPA: ATP-binding protein [Gemmatimonadaceae bacterium]|nr:ATP-binding protein [Gemmatimonadaceae bacterium]
MVETTAPQPIAEAALAAVKAELASADVPTDVARRVLDVVHAALAEERHFLTKLVDSLPVGLYAVDREYRVQAWNRKRESGMQGIARGDALGRTIFEILHRQPAESLKHEIDRVFGSGVLEQFETESQASGEARTYRISKIPMHLHDGNDVTHVITVGEDITEWKEALQRVAQAEKMAAIGQLAAGVMHEINNPLATISACAESLTLELGELEYLKFIDAEVERCKRIIDGLLDFSRKRSVTKEPIDVNATVQRTLFLLSHHARFKRVSATTNLGPPVFVRANVDQLIQVLMALLLNAADATEKHGQGAKVGVRTSVASATHEVAIEIIDNGVGIARSEVGKLFEPFYTTKPPGRGTGLGLSICYGLVADHGGRLEVESTPGSGSTFRVVLPMESAV